MHGIADIWPMRSELRPYRHEGVFVPTDHWLTDGDPWPYLGILQESGTSLSAAVISNPVSSTDGGSILCSRSDLPQYRS